jgi:hypothetical protein
MEYGKNFYVIDEHGVKRKTESEQYLGSPKLAARTRTNTDVHFEE